MKENLNQWEVISEWYHRIPINKFEEIMEVSIVHNNHINCFTNTRFKIRSEIKINSDQVYFKLKMKDYKILFRVKSFEKKMK